MIHTFRDYLQNRYSFSIMIIIILLITLSAIVSNIPLFIIKKKNIEL